MTKREKPKPAVGMKIPIVMPALCYPDRGRGGRDGGWLFRCTGSLRTPEEDRARYELAIRERQLSEGIGK